MPEIKEKDGFDPKYLADTLPMYYKRLFPHKQFYRWLSYNLCKYFFLAPKKKKCFSMNNLSFVNFRS